MSWSSRRVQKVERELREVIAQYLINGFKGSLAGLVSVSRVEAAPDLRSAKVYISVIGTRADLAQSLQSLNERVGAIQQMVGRRIHMKYCPKLSFFEDPSLEKIQKVEAAFRLLSTSTDE